MSITLFDKVQVFKGLYNFDSEIKYSRLYTGHLNMKIHTQKKKKQTTQTLNILLFLSCNKHKDELKRKDVKNRTFGMIFGG